MQQKSICSREVTVTLDNGLHLGPSSQIVQAARNHGCRLQIRKRDRVVDGTSMLELLTLAAEKGDVLELEARGDRAEELIAAIVRLFERKFAMEES